MASAILFVVFASLLLRAVVPLPISQDLENTQVGKLNNGLFVFNPDTLLSRGEVTEQVISLDSVPINRALRRSKRQVITGYHNCAEEMVWVWNRCVSLANLKENDDYDES